MANSAFLSQALHIRSSGYSSLLVGKKQAIFRIVQSGRVFKVKLDHEPNRFDGRHFRDFQMKGKLTWILNVITLIYLKC